MSKITRQNSENRKRSITRRLMTRNWPAQGRPMMRAVNVGYEVAGRIKGSTAGGIGMMHVLAS